jgi:hypothetical protein
MTKAEARNLLRQFDGVAGLEAWIAEQRWQVVPDGWTVTKDLEGWRFRLVLVPEGIRLSATAPGSSPPAMWLVPGSGTLER